MQYQLIQSTGEVRAIDYDPDAGPLYRTREEAEAHAASLRDHERELTARLEALADEWDELWEGRAVGTISRSAFRLFPDWAEDYLPVVGHDKQGRPRYPGQTWRLIQIMESVDATVPPGGMVLSPRLQESHLLQTIQVEGLPCYRRYSLPTPLTLWDHLEAD